MPKPFFLVRPSGLFVRFLVPIDLRARLGRRFLVGLFARKISRRLCNGVDHLIVPSTEMTHVLDAYGVRTPTTVLPTGIELSEFSGGDGIAFRDRHGIPREQPVLLTVSRLALEKNIAFLLRVTQRLVNANSAMISPEDVDAFAILATRVLRAA